MNCATTYANRWQIIYTLPKQEKIVAKELEKRNICSYLPCQYVISQWRDRKKKLHVPLFPNYVFVKLEKNEHHQVLKTPGVLRFVAFNRQPATITESEVNKIKLIVNGGWEVIKETVFSIGDRVRVVRGPLVGLEGVLIERKGSKRFAIQLESIHSTLSVDIQSYLFESVEDGYAVCA